MSKKKESTYALLNFRVGLEIKSLIEEKAELSGEMSVSAYIRKLVYSDLIQWDKDRFKAALNAPKVKKAARRKAAEESNEKMIG